ncbi:MAG: putative sugar O-methyltransferase [Actinomycetota bacterium]|nr:putative sugar O-methyltransferase [Actinomycetota bacterium]
MSGSFTRNWISTYAASRRLRLRNRLVAAIGLARTVEIFDRPAWLYRGRRRIPTDELRFRAPSPVTELDLALCERLIAAHARAQADARDAGGMWSHEIYRDRQRELVLALDRGNPTAVAELLGSMFRSDFILGMAPGSLGIGRQPRMLARLSYLATMSKLVSLAESQGTALVENPEQGAVGVALADGVDELMQSLEACLGLSLDFPAVGAAYGVLAAGRLITPDTPDQVYAAARIRDVMHEHLSDRADPLRVVEIGAGYGGMAYWLLKLFHEPLQYAVVDLPIVNVLQGYFLAQTLGHSQVSLYGEGPGSVAVLPGHALSAVEAPFDVLLNKDSMPEIPRDALLDYLRWARGACTGIFYSYNQEAAAEFAGTAQNVVPRVLAEIGGFARKRRDPSWLRRGYVEEVYAIDVSVP